MTSAPLPPRTLFLTASPDLTAEIRAALLKADLLIEDQDVFAPELVVCDNPSLARARVFKLRGSSIVSVLPDAAPATLRAALEAGADDFVLAPFEIGALRLRVRRVLHMRQLNEIARAAGYEVDESDSLLADLNERFNNFRPENASEQLELLDKLADVAEFRDDNNATTQRVALWAEELARRLGLDESHVALIRDAAPLHDVGKIGVAPSILLKNGALNDDERAQMQTHTAIGAQLLASDSSRLLQTAQIMALTHHERWDGNGYPHGLRGEEIPIEGRILAVVDVFDALTSERPHKKAWSRAAAIEEIQSNAGRSFDPHIVEVFLEFLGERTLAA